MVLAERNTEVVRNGRRSRGPSPNGHGVSLAGGGGTPDTSSDDDNSIKRNGKSKTKQSEYEEKIRVGRDYQAVCPPLIPEQERKPESINDRALLVWSPTKDIPDTKLEEYISVAKEKYGYNGEQALGMLFWHKHDLERAVMDLANFTPFPDEWTVEDKVLFEQAFQFHGKSFHRIRQMLPDKSIASLVKYYYSWKKTRHRQSVMDRQEKAKASKEGSENGSDNESNEESDTDDKDQTMASSSGLQESNSKLGDTFSKYSKSNDSSSAAADADRQQTAESMTSATNSNSYANKRSNLNVIQNNSSNTNVTVESLGTGRATPSHGPAVGNGGCCTNCGVACHILNVSPHGRLCSSCYHHWRRTGNKRPTSGPYFGKRSRDRNAERHKRKPPRGMYINHDDIVTLASVSDNQDELLANSDREIVSLLSQVQLNKQSISSLKRNNSEELEDIRPTDNTNRISSRWSNDELLLAVQGVRKYGKDFQAIADTLGTKTEPHVRTFYLNYRRRYNLDQVLKEYEAGKEKVTTSVVSAVGQKDAKSRKEQSVVDESDTNTTLSETAVSKFTEEAKSNSLTQKHIIYEIDLDDSEADTSSFKPVGSGGAT